MNRTFFVSWVMVVGMSFTATPQPVFQWEVVKRELNIPTDTLFIHHTGMNIPMNAERLSKTHRHRIYHNKPLPGHIRRTRENGTIVVRQTFVAYHWLIHEDGSAEQLLQDTDVAWNTPQAENNLRSVAICFDGDFSNHAPSDKALARCEDIIKNFAQRFSITEVSAHRDVRPTICPGDWIDAKRRDGQTWRQHFTTVVGEIQRQKLRPLQPSSMSNRVILIPVELVYY